MKAIPSLFLVLACSCLTAARPNILFIFTDDHAPHAIGAYGGPFQALNPTPNIDRLADQGMLFQNSFCTNSICGPSRAVIQTGKHSHKNGFRNNQDTFDWDQQTFPKLLQQAGYQTAIFGKSHLKGIPQGYDQWAVLPGQGLYYNPDFNTPDGPVTIEGYSTDLVTDMAVQFLKQDRDPAKPFVLMVQHKAPHRNWMPALRHLYLYEDMEMPEPETLFDDYADNASIVHYQEMEIDRHMDPHYDLFLDLTPGFDGPAIQKRQDKSAWHNMQRMTEDQLSLWRAAYAPRDREFHLADLSGKERVRWKYQRYIKNYLRTIKGVDESVGRLMRTLEDLGLSEDTIVIYSSDQGFYLGDHGWYDKRWMYEESLKMPFIVKWPGAIKPGSVNTDLIQNLDYAPTFLEMAGAPVPDDMQGRSLVPLMEGQTPEDWRSSIYYHFYEYPSIHMVPRHNGIRTERYKLIHFYEFDQWEFYDLQADPDERTNLYQDPHSRDTISGLKERLRELVEMYGDDTDTSPKPEGWQERMMRGD